VADIEKTGRSTINVLILLLIASALFAFVMPYLGMSGTVSIGLNLGFVLFCFILAIFIGYTRKNLKTLAP